MRLTDFAANTYSQFGEDGIIEHIFDRIGTESEFCVEFGASDSLDCSNIANLWMHKGWLGLAIEADPERAARLTELIGTTDDCTVLCRRVTPGGLHSIDNLIGDNAIDFMSIDVDGNDYHIWQKMQCKPRVIAIEFNPTVPPHISLYQEIDPTMMGFGASLRALIDLSVHKQYAFVGASEVNAFFVRQEFVGKFTDYERDPMKLFPLKGFTFLVSDFLGAALACGAEMPWSIHMPYDGPPIAGSYYSVTGDSAQTIRAYKVKYPNLAAWPQHQQPNIADPEFEGPIPGGKRAPISARNLLQDYLIRDFSPIVIAVDHVAPSQVEWVYKVAADFNFNCQSGGGVLVLTREQQ